MYELCLWTRVCIRNGLGLGHGLSWGRIRLWVKVWASVSDRDWVRICRMWDWLGVALGYG